MFSPCHGGMTVFCSDSMPLEHGAHDDMVSHAFLGVVRESTRADILRLMCWCFGFIF